MLNIVVPMAGRGTRFVNEGYTIPKPLIPVRGMPMINIVINNIRPKTPHRFIFICLQEHIVKYHLDKQLKKWAPGSIVISINTVTEGAACTVLLSKEYINNNDPLMIANSDQWVDIDINNYLQALEKEKADGLIMTMWADDPKWSFVKINETGKVVGVYEKQVVSNEATVGIYNFRRGSEFVYGAESMIKKNLRVNNEFYVAPVYNELIAEGKKIVIYNVGKVFDGMYGMGIPNDLKLFESMEISSKAVKLK